MTARTGTVPAVEFNASQAAVGELSALLVTVQAELVALEARRCDGCAKWLRPHGGMGVCSEFWPHHETVCDHYCREWEPKP